MTGQEDGYQRVMTPLEQVTEFHRVFGCAINEPWTVELGALRARLIAEECRELGEALHSGDPLMVAQELADIAYVTIGTAVSLGLSVDTAGPGAVSSFGTLWAESSGLAGSLVRGDIPAVTHRLTCVISRLYGVSLAEGIDLDAAVTAVHTANMSKLGLDGKPIKRKDGKVMKGSGYSPPDMTRAIEVGEPAEPRELVGRYVRQVWVAWAQEQPNPKPSWLLPWEDLDEGQREVDMRIGAALFEAGRRSVQR